MSLLRALIKRTLARAGYHVSRHDPRRDPQSVRAALFERCAVDAIFDVGANAGQYGERLRQSGYRGRIVSFEPLSAAFAELKRRAAADGNWRVQQCALGDHDGVAAINVAGNSWSSSLLPMLPAHLAAAPASAYVGREEVAIHRLDSVAGQYPCERAFLKIDTQGFTSKVLAGADRFLQRAHGLEVELSTVSLYEGEPLIHEVLSKLHGHGFAVFYLEPEVLGADLGQQLQLNGLFQRVG